MFIYTSKYAYGYCLYRDSYAWTEKKHMSNSFRMDFKIFIKHILVYRGIRIFHKYPKSSCFNGNKFDARIFINRTEVD